MNALFQAGLAREKAKALLRNGEFTELFAELGWDAPSIVKREFAIPLPRLEQIAQLRYVAEKRGFVICVCDTGDEKPTRDFRRAVGKELAKLHYENILIFRGGGGQFWQVSIRPQNRPLRVVTVVWYENQGPDKLLEKLDGVVFGVDEENELNIVDVVTRVRESFIQNAESVTRKFYDQFKKELDKFAKFISGLRAAGNGASRQWYAALMLNRLMFCYFIQKKGFLDGDINYLRNRLQQSRDTFGKDKFHRVFYREFLRRLFHEGLGAPPEMRKSDFKKMLGNIPYLNGGLFDPVDTEKENPELDIADGAFERVFNFFDQWNWHLDERPNASGKDINPDVIGYIFEKYINDRADMGAYYTQEDVTGHIARGAILPVVLRRARAECKTAFSGDGAIWKLLRDNPKKYIYAAAQYGCQKPDSEILKSIRTGLNAKKTNLAKRRKKWNCPASEGFGLPTETWREVIARRTRFFALRNSMKNGKCESIEALLSHNLDIQRFMDDALREYEGSDFIAAVFRALAGREPEKSNQHHRRPLSVLDPACGSGAFLFAALNVLAPLYRQCLNRMEEFVEEDDLRIKRKKGAQKKFPEFRRILAEVRAHPSEEYWIRKSCILHNLHGVDIMPEAMEIAKLRLFLNLAAKAECDPKKSNMGLEPLPDIDFNIRRGNALVGFADMADFNRHATKKLGFDQEEADKVRHSFSWVETADIRFREAQKNDTPQEYRAAKADLVDRLGKLDDDLNGYLAQRYGKKEEGEVRAWTQSHHPFHWISNFYGIMSGGGFDVVIGNPPYILYSRVRREYEVQGYDTKSCNNIYAMFIERALSLGRDKVVSMIVPSSAFSSERMSPLMDILVASGKVWLSCHGIRPAQMFADAIIRVAVFNRQPGTPETFVTNYSRWFSVFREFVFPTLAYRQLESKHSFGIVPKIGDNIASRILLKLRGKTLAHFHGSGRHLCYFHNAAFYWIRATDFIPYYWKEGRGEMPSPTLETLQFKQRSHARMACAVLSSSLFFWWFTMRSDVRALSKSMIGEFPFDMNKIPLGVQRELSALVPRLMEDYKHHAFRQTRNSLRHGKSAYDEFRPRRSKHIIDEIDAILARHYGFTDEELDYIVNYDVKFRTDGE